MLELAAKSGCFGVFIGFETATEEGLTEIHKKANHYGVAAINVLFLTPLPGTELWDTLDGEGRILSKSFPEDWQYYTLSHPVASYRHLSWADIVREMCACYRCFYSLPRIALRTLATAWRTRKLTCVLAVLATNLSYRLNLRNDLETYRRMELSHGDALETKTVKALPPGSLREVGSRRQAPSTTTPGPWVDSTPCPGMDARNKPTRPRETYDHR
jgi:hypothetical protein